MGVNAIGYILIYFLKGVSNLHFTYYSHLVKLNPTMFLTPWALLYSIKHRKILYKENPLF